MPDPSDQGTERPALEIKSILLLDDDVEFVEALRALLESRNFLVTAVTNGAEGLREIMSLDFDVIICDLIMPHMPGDMFYLAVKKTKPHLCSRFIFITGYSENPRVDLFLKQVNGLVLIKPVLADEMESTISLVLKRTDQSSAP
jgi:CheY-like chemotaxis protein